MTTWMGKASWTSTPTKNYRQLGKAGSRKGSLSQGGKCQLVVWCQAVSPKNIHTSNIIQTEEVISEYICIHTHTIYTYTIIINKGGHEFQEE